MDDKYKEELHPADEDRIAMDENISEKDQETWSDELAAEDSDVQNNSEAVEEENRPTEQELDDNQPDGANEKPAASDSESIDEAVDEIVIEEADELLAAEDEALESANTPEPKKLTMIGKLQEVIKTWWNRPRLRNATLASFAVMFIVLGLLPVTRYAMLNIAGVRVKATITIVDSVTSLPLQNIPVTLRDTTVLSDESGNVIFDNLRLGSTKLVVDRRGYMKVDKPHTVGWGSNPLGSLALEATGTLFNFELTDWLSGAALSDIEALSGEDIAKGDESGKITLNVSDYSDDGEAIVRASGYREERFKLGDLASETKVAMVPNKKHPFVSNRSGEFDLYARDVDGKNEKLLMKATGKEREVPFALPHPTKEVVAYITSRDGDVNKGGFVLDGLFIVDLLSGEPYKVARSEQVQLIGWSENKLLYVAVIEGVSAANSQRSKLISYDVDTKERIELASSNYFNDVKLIGDTIYYAVSSYAVPKSQAKLFSVKVDGSDNQIVLDDQVWSIARKNYESVLLNAENSRWYEFTVGGVPEKLSSPPGNKIGRVYTVSPDKKRASWVDVRDGKGVLLVYDVEQKKETVSQTISGLSDPVYWFANTYLIFRVSTSEETADYVLNIDDGEPKKIADVVGNRSRYFY
jgi:hypothetical protein